VIDLPDHPRLANAPAIPLLNIENLGHIRKAVKAWLASAACVNAAFERVALPPTP
jgi:hypothetical protein